MIILDEYLKLYSPYYQSEQTIKIILQYSSKNNTITDATSGIGGNSISFCRIFKKVHCVEINKIAYDVLIKNLKNFNNVEFYNNNYLIISPKIKQDIIFLDPPWEKNYKKKETSNLLLDDIPINIIIENLYNNTKIIALKAPLNYESITNNWNYTTHYIYKIKIPIYKIIIYYK